MPMVWYIPPLSPVVDALTETGHDGEDAGNLFGAIESLRIPVEYLAELFTAGDTDRVTGVLRKLGAMRSYMRDLNLGRPADESIAAAVGMTGRDIEDMHRLLAIAKYDERYVIPTGARRAGPRPGGARHRLLPGLRGRARAWAAGARSVRPPAASTPIAVENFHMLADRQTSDTLAAPRRTRRSGSTCSTGTARARPRGCSRTARDDARRRSREPAVSATVAARCAAQLATARQAASAAARLPRRGAARRGCRCCARPSRRCRRVRRAAGPVPRPRGDDAAGPSSQADYVETFDLRRRCCLYLTYYTYGDTRKRGMALLQFKHLYRGPG